MVTLWGIESREFEGWVGQVLGSRMRIKKIFDSARGHDRSWGGVEFFFVGLPALADLGHY